MTYRRIMAAVSGGSASQAVIDTACRLAKRFEANVEGFHVKWDAAAMAAITGAPLGLSIDAVGLQRLVADAERMARRMGETFRERAERAGLVAFDGDRKKASFGWRVAAGYAPELVAHEAILYDLVVVGRSDRVLAEPSSYTIEETLIRSGRPVLLTPTAPTEIGHHVVIGWNDSPQAARAVSASLPLLKQARQVSIITIGEKVTDGLSSIGNYIAWHGIEVRHAQHTQECGRAVGARLVEHARADEADLLVMGAFAHAPWQEALFGGASREALQTSGMAILLAH